jgi:Fe-Mn family superoxide dismutase
MAFELKALPYATDALEPHIDAKTMEIHHGKHHAAYVTNLNAAIEGTPLASQTLEGLISSIKTLPADKQAVIRNNGGGHYNHTLFWNLLTAESSGKPYAELLTAIEAQFGGFDQFKTAFETAAKTRFGSGWAWLIVKKDGQLAITSTPNQDNPLMDVADIQGTPILGLDVWEHAYYLHYQNRRPDYVAAFWNVVNWDYVQTLWNDAK